jgi:hypothetical protein
VPHRFSTERAVSHPRREAHLDLASGCRRALALVPVAGEIKIARDEATLKRSLIWGLSLVEIDSRSDHN